MELTMAVEADQWRDGLEAWTWLPLAGKRPLFASRFGHGFLEADDGIWWLDPISGDLTLEWPDRQSLQSALQTDAGQDEFLLGGLALGAERRGTVLADGEIYVFTPAPILGAGFDLDNVMAMTFRLGLSIQGQLHAQLRSGGPP